MAGGAPRPSRASLPRSARGSTTTSCSRARFSRSIRTTSWCIAPRRSRSTGRGSSANGSSTPRRSRRLASTRSPPSTSGTSPTGRTGSSAPMPTVAWSRTPGSRARTPSWRASSPPSTGSTSQRSSRRCQPPSAGPESPAAAGPPPEQPSVRSRRFGAGRELHLARHVSLSMTGWLDDLRLAARMLARRPGFSAVIVATLGLAIGANAAVFSFVDAILLRPLPVAAPERLVRIYSHFASGLDWASVSYPNYRDFERANRVFAALAAEGNQAYVVGDSASSDQVAGALVSANSSAPRGVRPALGRAFEPDEDRVASPVAVIGDGFWKRYFAADPRVLGRTATLNGTAFKVVGVAPAGFSGPNTGLVAEIWTPLSMQAAVSPGADLLRLRGAYWLQLTGRLRPGVSLQQAADAMNALAARLRQLYPRDNEGVSLSLLPESQAKIYPGVC